MAKRIILVGAPGSGKSSIVEDLDLVIRGEVLVPNDFAVGALSDYRTELLLVTQRLMDLTLPFRLDAVHKHSLLDSLAHMAARLVLDVEAGLTEQEIYSRWLAMSLTASIIRDSWKADLVLFIPGNAGDFFSKEVENSLEVALEEFNIEYTKLHSSEEAAKIVATFLNEGKNDESNAHGDIVELSETS